LVSGVNVAGGQGLVLVLDCFIAFLISRPRTTTTTRTIRKCPRLPIVVLVVVLRRRLLPHRQSDGDGDDDDDEHTSTSTSTSTRRRRRRRKIGM
jgi:hypothetical protein